MNRLATIVLLFALVGSAFGQVLLTDAVIQGASFSGTVGTSAPPAGIAFVQQAGTNYAVNSSATVIVTTTNAVAAMVTAGGSNYLMGATDPGFVDAANGDFRLTASSPLRGRGANLTIDPSASRTDADGNTRPSSGAWDIGPYQFGTNAVFIYHLEGISGGGFHL